MQRHIRVICSAINKLKRGPSISETICPGLFEFGTSVIKNIITVEAPQYINYQIIITFNPIKLLFDRGKLNLFKKSSCVGYMNVVLISKPEF